MTNETGKFNISNIEKGQEILDTTTEKTARIQDIEKRGRWHYITVGGEEFSEGKFFARFAEFKAPKAPKAAPAPKVKKVSDAHIQDAMTSSDIDEGTIEGLTGFAKFRKLHKAETVELRDSGIKVRIQDNGDDIAHSLLVEIDEVMAAKGIEASEAIWLTPLVKNNLDVKALKARYAHLNNGMVRMNIGNLLRGLFRKAAEAAEKK